MSIGAEGAVLARNAPSLANVAYRPVLTWFDPTVRRLEDQLMVPLMGHNPIEMGAQADKMSALFAGDAEYRRLFAEVFAGDSSVTNAARAIAAFERTLISFNSPWDRYRAGDGTAISAAAKRGEGLFFSERTQCFRCHPAPHFTDTYASADLPFAEIGFHDIGFDDEAGARMRAPSLRNVAVTAPYMHDGTVATLTEVVEIYASGGRGTGRTRATKSAYITGLTLSEAEKRDLIAFLESLTDEGFLTDRRFSDPFAP